MFAAFIFIASTQTQKPSQIVLPKDPYDVSSRVAIPREKIKVVYYRPSAMAKMLHVQEPVELQADDKSGVLLVSGWPRQVDDVRNQLRSADVPRRTVQLHVLVTSPSSSFRFEGDVKLLTNQSWSTIDGDTGATICLEANARGKDSLQLSASVSWKVPSEGSGRSVTIVSSAAASLRNGEAWTMPKSGTKTEPNLKIEITPTVLDTPPSAPYLRG